jgi:ATP-dependent 26S proteasome regulatory subunit
MVSPCRAEDAASKQSVLQALTRKFALAADVDLADLATRCPPQLTGADMYALCADAWMNGLKRLVAVRPSLPHGGFNRRTHT